MPLYRAAIQSERRAAIEILLHQRSRVLQPQTPNRGYRKLLDSGLGSGCNTVLLQLSYALSVLLGDDQASRRQRMGCLHPTLFVAMHDRSSA